MSQSFVVSLHPGQAAIYNSTARFRVCAAGRRFGKSYLAANLLAIEALREVNEAGYTLNHSHGVYYVAPTFDQAKRIMWPTLHQLLGFERTGGLIRNENVNDGWIELINGRRIYIRGADNPDSLRGIALSYVVLDEYADMKANVWHEIVEPALMDVEGRALFIGTPKGKNHFYRLFMGALTKPVNQRTGNNDQWQDWEAFHFKSTDNPFLAERELRRMLEGDNRPQDVIRQEIEASFISGGSKVLKPDNFVIVPKAPPLSLGSTFITVDLAGFKKQEGNKIMRTDESVVAQTLVVGDKWYILNIDHGHWDVRMCAMKIVLACRDHVGARLGIEQGALKEAVGPYLEEYMREYDRYVTPEELRHGGNKKSDRITWALQGRSERQMIHIVKGEWNDWFLSQLADFPDPLSPDDGIDAVAYVDQMARANYITETDLPEWVPVDLDSGY
jgi:Terminase large subunit, T4likevirus-type, N-terminal